MAGVDIGTNSLLLVVARPSPSGLVVLEDRAVVTRLGEQLADSGRLRAEAMDRTVAVLEEFGAALKALGATGRAAATSAVRRAVNARALLDRAERALGLPVSVLSGADEARLTYRGALSELPGLAPADRPIVVDPGGGSTEVFDGERGLSLELGAVRLTERFLRGDPPRADETLALVDHVRAALAPIAPAGGRPVVAVGGTATTLAALEASVDRYDRTVVHGSRLPLERLRRLGSALASQTVAEREGSPLLPPGRADVIVAGALLLGELVERLGASEALVSDRGLRYGLVAEALDAYSTRRNE